MKITKEQLKKLIKEEIKKTLISESKKFNNLIHLEQYVRENTGSALHLALFEHDDNNQIVIYTNLYVHPDGSIHNKPYVKPEKQTPLGKRISSNPRP